MKQFLLALALFVTALSASAQQICLDNTGVPIPAGQPGNPGITTPYYTAPTSGYTCGYSPNQKLGGSMGDACQLAIPAGLQVCNCNASGCFYFDPNGAACSGQSSWIAGQAFSGGAAYCPTNYTLNGSTCKSDSTAFFDTSLTGQGATITRAANGTMTSMSTEFGTESVLSADSLGRPTYVLGLHGTVNYTYFPNSPLVATRSDLNGAVQYTWFENKTESSITLPDGSAYNFSYGRHAGATPLLTGVGVVNGVIGGSRAGTLAPWGVPIPYVTSALSLPTSTMLAKMLEGFFFTNAYATTQVAPFANMDVLGYFRVGLGSTQAEAEQHSLFPLTDELLPAPVQDNCIAQNSPPLPPGGYNGNSDPMSHRCKMTFIGMMQRFCPDGRCTSAQATRIMNAMIFVGCG